MIERDADVSADVLFRRVAKKQQKAYTTIELTQYFEYTVLTIEIWQ